MNLKPLLGFISSLMNVKMCVCVLGIGFGFGGRVVGGDWRLGDLGLRGFPCVVAFAPSLYGVRLRALGLLGVNGSQPFTCKQALNMRSRLSVVLLMEHDCSTNMDGARRCPSVLYRS